MTSALSTGALAQLACTEQLQNPGLDGLSLGTHTSIPGWTFTGSGTVFSSTTSSIEFSDEVGGLSTFTQTISQTGLQGLDMGLGANGAPQVTIVMRPLHGNPQSASLNAFLTVNVGGVNYAQIDTGGLSNNNLNSFATITYLNGATGNLSSMLIDDRDAAGDTDVTWVITLPSGISPPTGDFAIVYDPSSAPGSGDPFGAFFVPNDDFNLESVSIVTCSGGISGNVFDDADGLSDSTVDGTGTNVGGTLFATLLDASGTTVIAVAPIAADGSYSFADVVAGTTYAVQLGTVDETAQIGAAPSSGASLPEGWLNVGENLGAGAGDDGTADGLLTVVVTTSGAPQANFGIQLGADFGDAPDTYSTLLASGGPSHSLTPDLTPPGLQSCSGAEAQWLYDGDNNDSSGNGHNPVSSTGNVTTYATSPFGQSLVFDGASSIRYSSSPFLNSAFTSRTVLLKVKPGSVSGLQLIFDEGGLSNGLVIALNGNQFEVQTAEGNVKAPLLIHPTLINVDTWYDVKLVYDNGTITLTVDGVSTTPLNTGFGQLATHGDEGGIGSIIQTSTYNGGEGGFTGEIDAACYYTTTTGDFDTPVAASDILLGTERDYELDGAPDAAANGDNSTGTSDDEDGVTIGPLRNGFDEVIPYTVTYNGGNTVFYLNAWIDWNGDGDFLDAGEQIATDVLASAGANNLNITVPELGLVTNLNTYARFRLSSQQGLGAGGAAIDGEVEDYFLTLAHPTAVTIGEVSLKSMSLLDYFSQLGIDRMSRAQLLEVLRVWVPELAEQLTQASIKQILQILEGYLDADGDGQVAVLHWDTIEERSTIGFYVDRRQLQANWVRLNNNLLPGLISSPLGAEYQLVDRFAEKGEVYHYRLIELEGQGNTREYGPYTLTMP